MGYEKFWVKPSCGFQFSPKKNWVKFLQTVEKVKIWNFISWFCLKEKLPEQKIDIAVSCPDTEELWKVSEKSELWFPIQPTQNSWNFFKQEGRSKFQISSIGFV